MSAFSDLIFLQFTQDAFVTDWLTNQVGLGPLLRLTYEPQDVEFHAITLGSVQRTEYQLPAFETLRTRGIDEKVVPTTERVKVDRNRPRSGRLSWVDVFLETVLSVQVASLAMPVERITSQSLLDKLGGVASLEDLRTKLGNLYAPSVVDAIFDRLQISTLEEFTRQPTSYLEFFAKAPPPFNPDDPANVRNYSLNVCIQIQAELAVREALQAAKLCRSILENEEDFTSSAGGADVISPYAFVVVFPAAAVVDNALPGRTAAQIKADVQNLFNAEHMLAHFA